MEQVQRRFVTFNKITLEILSITWEVQDVPDHVSLPVLDFKLVLPFFNLTKRINEYYPIIENNVAVGFRRRGMYESQVVLETEENILRGLRSFENFITQSRIMLTLDNNEITLRYDRNYFDELSHQENLERLKLAGDKLYNLYITRKGDPFTIYDSSELTLEPFTVDKTIVVPYNGPTEISAYVVTKN